MSLEENKEIVRMGIEAASSHELDLLDDLMVPDFVNHVAPIRSREEMKRYLKMQIDGFPDIHWHIEDMAADGDMVWTRYTVSGTHTSEFRGLAPTGKKIEFSAVSVYRVVDGKMTEGWSIMQFFDLYKQLGVIEYKGFPDEIIQPI